MRISMSRVDDAWHGEVIARAREHRSLGSLAVALGVNPETLSRHWRWWRQVAGRDIPALGDLLNRGMVQYPASPDDDPTLSAANADMPRARSPRVEDDPPEYVEPPELDTPANESPERLTPPDSGFVFITSDHHYPVHDKSCEAAIAALARDLKPARWIFNGDVFDAWWMSRHQKEARRLFSKSSGPRLVDELDAFRPFGQFACDVAEWVDFGEGNHEARVRAHINEHPALFDLPGLSWPQMLALDRANVTYHGTHYRMWLDSLSIVHGDRIGGRFGVKHACDWVLSNHGRTTVFGHTHRVASLYRSVPRQDGHGMTPLLAINGGHLCQVEEAHDWCPDPAWTHGFVVVEFYTVAGKRHYTAHPIAIIDGRFSFGGKVYDGRLCQ